MTELTFLLMMEKVTAILALQAGFQTLVLLQQHHLSVRFV